MKSRESLKAENFLWLVAEEEDRDLKHKGDSTCHHWPREKDCGQPLGAESRAQAAASKETGTSHP